MQILPKVLENGLSEHVTLFKSITTLSKVPLPEVYYNIIIFNIIKLMVTLFSSGVSMAMHKV